MTTGEVLGGLVLLSVMVVPVAFGARRLRRRLLPAWHGAPAALVDVVLVLTHLSLLSELLGTVGLFDRALVVAAAAASGCLVGLLATPPSVPSLERGGEAAPATTRTRAALAVAGLAVAVVVARWMLPTAHTYRTGFLDDDTVSYHLPFAARFVQEGRLTDLHFVVPEIPIAFYPAGGELFHALGMLAFGDDLLSPGLNLAWLALLFLAAWCVGRRAGPGVGAAAVAGVAVVAGSPLVVTSQAGSGHIDVAGVALLLAAAALLVTGRRQTPAVVVAGLAAGLALGTKYTFLIPVAALTLGLAVLAWREGRRRLVAGWVGAVSVAGGYWYLRNLFEAGSPLPPTHLGIGPLGFQKTDHAIDAGDGTIVQYLDQPRVMWRVLRTAALEGFGPLWPLVLVGIAAGIGLVIWRARSPVHLMLALVALVSAIGYFFVPATAFGVGEPIQVYVTANVRYALPALVLAAALLATSRVFERSERQLALTVALAVLVVSMQPASRFIWEAWRGGVPTLPGLLAGAAVLAITAALLIGVHRRLGGVARVAVAATAAAGIVVGSVLVADRYGEHRFREDRSAFGQVFNWAQEHGGERIGVAGTFRHYPLYGPEQANYVQYVGVIGDRHRFQEATSCRAWREAVNEGRYDTIVTMPGREFEPVPKQRGWTASDPAAREVLHRGKASVFEVDGKLEPSCRGTGGSDRP